MSLTVLNKENIKNEVLNSEKTVLLDFYADWCGPCRMIVPLILEISDERNDIKVCKFNVSDQPELASYFEVISIPTLAVIKNGKLVNSRMSEQDRKSKYLLCFKGWKAMGILRFLKPKDINEGVKDFLSVENAVLLDVRTSEEYSAGHIEGSKNLTVKNLESGEAFDERYDKLLISTRAKPIKPPFDGIDADNIFTLRTVEDTLKIREYAETKKPRTAVIAGGGFIGLETVENLRELGMEVTLVQGHTQLMTPFDSDMAAFIHAEVRKHGVNLVLDRRVVGFEIKGEKLM